MSYKSVFALAGLFFLAGCCNKNCDANNAVSQKYIHKYGFEVSPAEWDERKGNGQIVTTFPDGSVQTCAYKNNLRHGVSTLSYPNSATLKEKSEYLEGQLSKKTSFDLSGQPVREELYEENGKTTITLWGKNGAPLSVEEYQMEKLVSGQYFTPQNKLESSIADGSGIRVKRNEAGTLLSQDAFENGELKSRTTFHFNGQIKSLSNFSDYKLSGIQQHFAPNGTLIREATWQDGTLTGLEICYRGSKKFIETPYLNGLRDGLEKEYDKEGALVRETPWKENKKHGLEHFYYKDYTDIQWYFLGEAVSLAKFNQLRLREEMIADLSQEPKPLESAKTVQ
ncbi:MAG: hypothetical protein WC371_05580 [Parachlamydiales bacterium]|jgi:antitoxin component YwqK of YwqJK toxin-antitoxin module